MIDKKFSAEAFEACGKDSEKAQYLADLLRDEIQKELDTAIHIALKQVVEKINRMGHKLALYEKPTPGEISYRDCSDNNDENSCKLRVAVDTVISTGYAHLISDEQLDD